MIFSSFKYFYSYLGKKIFLMLLLSMSVGVLDGLGLTMFLPLIQMAGGDSTIDGEALGKLSFLIDAFKSMGINFNLVSVLLIMMVFFILKGILSFISGYLKVIFEQEFIRKIRFYLIQLLNQLPFKFYVNYDLGRIQNTMTGEVGRVVGAYNAYFAAFEQLILVIVYITFAFLVNPAFASLITIGGLLTSLIYKKIYSVTRDTSAELTKNTHSYQGLLIQHTANFKYLKATGNLAKFGKKLNKTVLLIERSNKRIGMLRSLLWAAREPLLVFVVVLVIILQTQIFSSPMGSIMVSLLFFYRSLTYLLGLQNQWNLFVAASGSLNNMTAFQDELESNKENIGKKKYSGFKKSIILQNVTLSYDKKIALHDVDIEINKNEVIAFVGPSGSGKTSLINLLSGLIPPDKGEILIDNDDLSYFNKKSYQNKIGYITQDPVIFNDTVFNNVTLWIEPNLENIKKFHDVLKLANISEYVENLPQKENSILGYNGINLSGGQKQRISIARELFKEIDILIMDEATSSLDSETESNIKKNIESLKGKYTLFIVAHRLSTIKNVDKIIMLNEGKVTFQGTFVSLKKNVPDFARMVELQGI